MVGNLSLHISIRFYLKGEVILVHWPEFVELKEVGPRDGLQNEKIWIPTEEKVEWINMLSYSGVREIEYSSFVNPQWIPSLKDAREVGRMIYRNPDVIYSALVPNEIGLEAALETGVDRVSVFMSASETHNKRNINKTIDETYSILANVIKDAKQAGKKVTGYVSTVFECPFEGKVEREAVIRVVDRMFELGVDDVSLGDTIGTAVPSEVEELLEVVVKRYPNKQIIMHFHDTRGMAIANIVTSMRYGITRFDTAIGGLGGCPYAPGAAGNVATNDVLYLLHGLGIKTGINEAMIHEASLYIQNLLDVDLPSRTIAYLASQDKKSEEQADRHKVPQRKREMIYIFLKNQYGKIINRD